MSDPKHLIIPPPNTVDLSSRRSTPCELTRSLSEQSPASSLPVPPPLLQPFPSIPAPRIPTGLPVASLPRAQEYPKVKAPPILVPRPSGIFSVCSDPIDFEKYPDTIGKHWVPIEVLKNEKRANAAYSLKIDNLSTEHGFVGWKKVRGDGNCYYRAVIYSYLEHLVRPYTSEGLDRFLAQLREEPGPSKTQELYQKARLYLIPQLEILSNLCRTDQVKGFVQFHQWMQHESFDRALILTLRALAADYFSAHSSSEEIAAFLDPQDISGIMASILTEKEEAEGLMLLVVAKALDIQIVQYMIFEQLTVVRFPEHSESSIQLPIIIKLRGHYDVLYHVTLQGQDHYDFQRGTYSFT